MAWLAVHPGNTITERVPEDGPSFVFGFWPPLEAEIINSALSGLGLPKDATLESMSKLAVATVDRMLRYGIRGWSGFVVDGVEIPCNLEEVEVEGRKHKRLTLESLDYLYANRLALDLSKRCHAFNTLSEDQKKRHGLQSPSVSSKSATDAATATRTAPGAIPLPSYDSAATNSTAVRSG